MEDKELWKLLKTTLKETLLETIYEQGLVKKKDEEEFLRKLNTKKAKKILKAQRDELERNRLEQIKEIIEKKMESEDMKAFYAKIRADEFKTTQEATDFLLKRGFKGF